MPAHMFISCDMFFEKAMLQRNIWVIGYHQRRSNIWNLAAPERLFDSLIRHFFEMHLQSERHQGIIGGMATLW